MKKGILELAPNEEIIFEENGYTLTEQPYDDGSHLFTIYNSSGDWVDEFEDLPVDEKVIGTPSFKDTYVYETFVTIVESDIDMWDDDNVSYTDYVFDDKFGSSFLPKQKTPEEVEAQKKYERELVDSLCKSDTIVFHMDDPSTVMLIPIYEGKGWDVYRGSGWGISREAIKELIEKHDKILCLGHGTPGGLIGGTIGTSEVPYLKGKKIFALWCYAATFFRKNGFEGQGILCSDNAPSEVWECRAACDAEVSADWIYNNMLYWSECLKPVVELSFTDPHKACEIARKEYHKCYDDCTTDDERRVVDFNTNTLQVV